MGRYIKKHKRQFVGIALPLFFFFILAATGLSIFPGWLRPSLATPGNACTTGNGELFNASCDVCNGEICTFNTVAGEDQCAIPILSGTPPSPAIITSINFDPSATPFPQCPIAYSGSTAGTIFFAQSPGCWNVCSATPSNGSLIPACAPNDGFCQDISGGTAANDCRTGDCLPSATFDPGNPTGCDYDYSGGTDCVNCAPPADPAVNCGNGVCEQEIGEDFDSCALDCAVPGFDAIASQSTMDAACNVVITFPGNTPFFGLCEDGDVCTVNTCSGLTCDSPPATCDDSVIDFCCPSGCSPSDDLDCLTPEVCEPTPSPSPTPTAPPQISGNGCSLHKGE